MKWSLLSVLLATVAAVGLGLGSAEQSAEAAPPGAAWNLSAQNVTPTQARFNWTSSGWGTQQWVDLSFWNGYYWQWQHGGPLGTWATSYTWNGLQPNTTYYVRINTGTYYGVWLASDWVAFTTPGANPCYGYGTYVMPTYPYGAGITACPNPAPWVRIWTQGGEGATYRVNQTVQVCYQVSYPMYIQIIDILANGVQQTFLAGYDDGRGDCLPGYITPPPGLERMIIYGANGANASTYFNVTY